jgi:ribosomal protein S26
MSFCPICSNTYNINKSVDITLIQKGGKFNEEEIIKQILDKKVVESQILATIDLTELVKKSYYKKLLHKDKEYVYNVISHQQTKKEDNKGQINKKAMEGNRAYFQCTKCGNQEPIKPKTMIFSNIFDKTVQNTLNEDTSYMIYDNTLPRTKEYVCINKQCVTHKDPSKKEAIFIRQGKSYKLTYSCTVCKTKWNLI